jgi:hypothetical protein
MPFSAKPGNGISFWLSVLTHPLSGDAKLKGYSMNRSFIDAKADDVQFLPCCDHLPFRRFV